MRSVRVPIDIDADFPDHLGGDGGIAFRRFHQHGPAVCNERAAIERELVALGMAAKIVVIVEHQDAGLRVDIATIDVRRGQAADARTDDNQVVVLAGLLRGPAPALHRGVGRFEGTRVGAAHPGLGRRVVHRFACDDRFAGLRAGR